MKRNRRYRRNAVTQDDMIYLGVAAVTAFGIGMIIGRKHAVQETAAATAGLGAYFINPVVQPIHGIGSYVAV